MITTIGLIAVTIVALTASALAVGRACGRAWPDRAETVLGWLCTVGIVAAFVQHEFIHGWRPLAAHVDGLLLISALLAVTVMYLRSRPSLRGLGVVGWPILTLLLAWSVCADRWTFKPFGIDAVAIGSVWMVVHRAAVYGGLFFYAVAAIAGGLYLAVLRRLRAKRATGESGALGNLESAETLIVRSAAIGFALITLGLVTGLLIVTSAHGETNLGPGWWHSPKVVLATAVWLTYALVMNVRHTTHFRGARAAWLSIAGLVLLLVTFGVVTALSGKGKGEERGANGPERRAVQFSKVSSVDPLIRASPGTVVPARDGQEGLRCA